ALDGKTVICTPDKFFSAGEKVQVMISPLAALSGKNTASFSFTFQISRSKILPFSIPSTDPKPSAPEISGPWLAPLAPPPDAIPQFKVLKTGEPSPGQIYLASLTTVPVKGGAFLMIGGNGGDSIWYR